MGLVKYIVTLVRGLRATVLGVRNLCRESEMGGNGHAGQWTP